jgi:hypothetical protein
MRQVGGKGEERTAHIESINYVDETRSPISTKNTAQANVKQSLSPVVSKHWPLNQRSSVHIQLSGSADVIEREI